MRENKKYKQVKVRCFKTGQNLFSEIFQNITEKKLEKELNKMVQAGWDRFDIKRTDENNNTHINTLILNKSRLDTGSAPNSAEETTGSDPGLNGIKKQKS